MSEALLSLLSWLFKKKCTGEILWETEIDVCALPSPEKGQKKKRRKKLRGERWNSRIFALKERNEGGSSTMSVLCI